MSKDAEIREIGDACAALSPLNRERAYDVASALKFAENPVVQAVDGGLTGTSGEVPCGSGGSISKRD
jgi:hypothetical protein